MHPKKHPFLSIIATLVCAASLLSPGRTSAQPPDHPTTRLFFRMVGAASNAPILPKTRSAWTENRRVKTSNTGMADEGYTEFPFCAGRMDFCFTPRHAIFPRLVSGARADLDRVNGADLIVHHVYQPDGCVWGVSARRFVQTFTATKSELVSATLLVASTPGLFEAVVLEGGVGGKPLGPAKRFVAGHSTQWGTAYWQAGQVPLEPGRKYAIRVRRVDGEPWRPYLHSLGDAYADGFLTVDDQPHPNSDLALWIVEQPDDLVRGLVPEANDEGWTYDQDGVWFRPRSANVRLIMLGLTPVRMDPPTDHNCCDMVIRVFDEQGRLVAGPKRSLACGKVGDHEAPFLFASDELLVDPKRRYRVKAFVVPHKADLPTDPSPLEIRRDMKLEVFGEPEVGTMPAIHNLSATIPTRGKLRLRWDVNMPCDVRVAIEGDGMEGVEPGRKLAHFPIPADRRELTVDAWPGHSYRVQLSATGKTGRRWDTPTYLIKMWREEPGEAVLSESRPMPGVLLPLAPTRVADARDNGPLRYLRRVELTNGGFEQGLEGWRASDPSLAAPDVGIEGKSPLKDLGIETLWGDRLAGFTHQAGADRTQVFWEATLTRSIETIPGHVYQVALSANTSVDGGPRGDTRVRVMAGPGAGDDLSLAHGSQWYWTDGRWTRFTHEFRAVGESATIGAGFFRWRDIDRASAYVDEIHVYDLGPAPRRAEDSSPLPVDVAGNQSRPARKVALVERRDEVDERVEAHAAAPPGYVITGLGARAHRDNITTMWLRVQPLRADGSLGEAEQVRSGWEMDSHLEASVELPPGYVATGFGAGIAPEWDVKRLGVWARPLLPDGSLGEERLFRGGTDLNSGFEKTVRLEEGRVLTSAGLNCGFNDVNRIKASSARLVRTAYGRHADR